MNVVRCLLAERAANGWPHQDTTSVVPSFPVTFPRKITSACKASATLSICFKNDLIRGGPPNHQSPPHATSSPAERGNHVLRSMDGGSGSGASRNFGRLPLSRYRNAHWTCPGPKLQPVQWPTYLGWFDYYPLRRWRSGEWSGLEHFTAKPPRAQPIIQMKMNWHRPPARGAGTCRLASRAAARGRPRGRGIIIMTS